MNHNEPSRNLVHNARREAWIVFWIWAAALVWTVGWYYLFALPHEQDSLVVQLGLTTPGAVQPRLILGFPGWVFWGIIVPWLACSLFTVWFGLAGMADDDLGAEPPGEGGRHGH